MLWHALVIILENGKRRAGKVHGSEIIKGLVIQAKGPRNYLMGPRVGGGGSTKGPHSGALYDQICHLEILLQLQNGAVWSGSNTGGEENKQERSVTSPGKNHITAETNKYTPSIYVLQKYIKGRRCGSLG